MFFMPNAWRNISVDTVKSSICLEAVLGLDKWPHVLLLSFLNCCLNGCSFYHRRKCGSTKSWEKLFIAVNLFSVNSEICLILSQSWPCMLEAELQKYTTHHHLKSIWSFLLGERERRRRNYMIGASCVICSIAAQCTETMIRVLQ